MWVITRHITKSEVSSQKSFGIPSFSAVNSLLMIDTRPLMHIAFTPIIPHPATDFDTIHTSMINFQDVILQKELQCGPLWCDKGAPTTKPK